MDSYLLVVVLIVLLEEMHKDQEDHSSPNSEYVKHVGLRCFEACGRDRERVEEEVSQIDEARDMYEKVEACYGDCKGCHWPS